MIWILFVILVNGDTFYTAPDSIHNSMESCVERRAQIVDEVGRPVINYDAVCIAIDQGTL